MKFVPLPIEGAYAVLREPHTDERGFFARMWCEEEFAAHGLSTQIVQCSMSMSLKKGTLRGMHFQTAPHEEIKFIRCTRGAMYDVLLDLRPDSPTYLKWHAEELTETNGTQLYIPAGIAHGFQSLEDNTEMCYQISAAYASDFAGGVRWDDPAFGIVWPEAERTISRKDQEWPDYSPLPVSGK
jgi:dTDP-4-dehydrorhamnose 3,5-epimerase